MFMWKNKGSYVARATGTVRCNSLRLLHSRRYIRYVFNAT